jgi:thiamine biosynthesis lipoprotein
VAEVLWCCADARRRSGGAFDPWAGQGGVDPSGLLRGWAVAGALDILARSGMRAALIDAGGVVGAFGGPGPARGWSVAVPAPSGTGGRAGWVVENAQAVATVGSPQGPGGGWATVVGPDPALAEALAAGVLAAGGDLGVLDRAPGYRGLWAGPDGALRVGAGFPGAPWGAVARPRHAVAAA